MISEGIDLFEFSDLNLINRIDFLLEFIIIQSKLLFCLQFFSMSEKFWQYWRLSLLERQLLKFCISDWQGFCCCWGACCCCCCWGWLCDDPPIRLRTAWWATSDPAPKAIPWTIVLPIPDNIPPLFCWVWGCWRGACWCWVGIGLVAVVAVRDGDGDDLPLDDDLGMVISNNYNWNNGEYESSNINKLFSTKFLEK